MDIDFNDIKFRIIFVIVILFIISFVVSTEEVLECKNKYSFCTITKTNMYNISRTQKIMVAGNIAGTSVEDYLKEEGSKHSRRIVKRYRLYFESNTGAKKEIFSNYDTEREAREKGEQIMLCLKNGSYPCKTPR